MNQNTRDEPNQISRNEAELRDEADRSEVAARVSEAVKSAGGSTKISRDTGIPISSLHEYMAGKREMKSGTAVRLAVAANVNIEWLLTGNGAMLPQKSSSATPSLDQYAAENRVMAVNEKLLIASVVEVERLLQERNLHLAPEKKGELIALIYTVAMKDESVPDMGFVERMVRLAS